MIGHFYPDKRKSFFYLRRCENWPLSLYPINMAFHNLSSHGGWPLQRHFLNFMNTHTSIYIFNIVVMCLSLQPHCMTDCSQMPDESLYLLGVRLFDVWHSPAVLANRNIRKQGAFSIASFEGKILFLKTSLFFPAVFTNPLWFQLLYCLHTS